ncbi:MAG: hypothetical protein GX601_12690, partial [Anaerolineales bacterium]|nr:hypothetical protein [Anaerolineales bacterium]
MEYAVYLQRKHESALSALTRLAERLERVRGKQKKELEQEMVKQANQLLGSVVQDAGGHLENSLALATLYQELSIASELAALALRGAWQRAIICEQETNVLGSDIERWNLTELQGLLEEPGLRMDVLPAGTWLLRFEFTLAKPYISHDDEASYLVDNPVTKDHVLGLPLIRPSSWKGNLRSALRLTKGWSDERPEMARLFGNQQGAENGFRAGRLQCFPTFFRRIGLEIINPHD